MWCQPSAIRRGSSASASSNVAHGSQPRVRMKPYAEKARSTGSRSMQTRRASGAISRTRVTASG
jgi:hypothetical protein